MEETFKNLSRLRKDERIRRLVQQTTLSRDDLIMPLFIHHGENVKHPITAMEGQYQWSVDQVTGFARELVGRDVRAVLLFGIPAVKDPLGACALDDDDGVIQRALRALKQATPELVLITDLCFCEYTDHGHCGVLVEREGRRVLDHAATRERLVLQALSHARAGTDMIAPSGMIDGQVSAIRQGLDANGFGHIPIMAYTAKYASSFYGPFREAAGGAPSFGDRRSHQLDPANSDEALREAEADIAEGADILMVKPAGYYGDIIRRLRDCFNLPIAAYQVSGEYAMIKAAAARGRLDEAVVIRETLLSIKRAGADLIITYFAGDEILFD
ncbi:MAG: porphobilinogen synthase [Sedimentisphaerales bacterium]|nr:porphobilinogen synthase [Sedimentisphaerales bacterium]